MRESFIVNFILWVYKIFEAEYGYEIEFRFNVKGLIMQQDHVFIIVLHSEGFEI